MTVSITLSQAIARHATVLKTQGYCLVPDALPAAAIAALDEDLAGDFARTPFGQGHFYGETTKRFGRLLIRTDHARALVQHELILGIVETILSPWCDCIQLNATQAIAIHPGAPAQFPHRDHDMWRGPVGAIEYLVNVMWPLTPFTPDNGATLIWPRSHGVRALDADPPEASLPAEMVPGAALLLLGSTLHGAGANITGTVRRGLVVGYALGWLKPYENPWLAYPPAIARTFPPALAALVGYRQHRPNLGNYEGQCPSVLLGDHIGSPLGAVDALRPDQQAVVESYAIDQQAAS